MCPAGTLSCTSSQLLSCPTDLNEAPGWPRHRRAACLRSCRVVSRASALPKTHIHSAVLSLRDRWPGRLARETEGTFIEPRSELPAISLETHLTSSSFSLTLIWSGVSRVACRAQRGRVGGTRWGWVLQMKFPCDIKSDLLSTYIHQGASLFADMTQIQYFHTNHRLALKPSFSLIIQTNVLYHHQALRHSPPHCLLLLRQLDGGSRQLFRNHR